MMLSTEDRKLLQQVAAYFEVWAKWSQDPVLIEEAAKFRRADSSAHRRRFFRLKMQGYINTEGEKIVGGGVAFPLTEKGRKAISVEEELK
jgi:hypothetical protein